MRNDSYPPPEPAHEAMNASAPTGHKCADCNTDKIPCADCYRIWWIRRRLPIGPTGQYPQGVLDSEDEGQLQIAIAWDAYAGIVRLEFGTPVKWLGLPPTQARELGESLIRNADHA